ncbi:MAG TPA: hypothetical protein VLJ86_18980 [Ramlibacter sp.]|nr:hypothetical protein [Ramlibacter sp.]
MNENSDTPFSTSVGGSNAGASSVDSGGMGASYDSQGRVQKMAQKAHEAVDKLEQTIGSGSDRMMSWQQEYGDMARDQVRSNPIAAIGIAFGVGILFSKLFMR